MSTRGALGFRIDSKDKVTYNHCDSYPEYLGVKILDFIKNHSIDEMKEIANNIQLVENNSIPSEEQIAICEKAGFVNLQVSNKSKNDWYCLLRDSQGDLSSYKKVPFMLNYIDFLYDSLFCEWAYIINLDENVFEVYKGFNKNPYASGRYSSKKDDTDSGYCGVKFIVSFNLDEARKMTNEDFIKFVFSD